MRQTQWAQLLAIGIAITGGTAMAQESNRTHLTIYRSDNARLFAADTHGPVQAGLTAVHESRSVDLDGGRQTITLDGLPSQIDTEALRLHFADDSGVNVLAQRLLLGGNGGLLDAAIGQRVTVLGDNRQVLAEGTLLDADNGLVLRSGTSVALVHDYAAVLLDDADTRDGHRLQVALDAATAGTYQADLGYPTGGIGWRAAYTATLGTGEQCSIQFSADASIANRSGRDWNDAAIRLIAGEPNTERRSGPQPMMMAARGKVMEAAYDPPQQAQLGDYRSFTLPGRIDLPNASITQTPLYEPRQLDCKRTWLYEIGNAWHPPHPRMDRGGIGRSEEAISSRLSFQAFDSLPAGYLRVLLPNEQALAFVGEARIGDTPKGQEVEVELGTSFDLRAQRERTDFQLDRAGNTLEEAFRVRLSNAGEVARTVTVREHPNRWREWSLVSSSIKPNRATPDTLEFEVTVPAGSETTLEYRLRYRWLASDLNN